MRRVLVDPEAPQRDALQEAAKWILVGGIVALPTDTFYGFAADPVSPGALPRPLAHKGGPAPGPARVGGRVPASGIARAICLASRIPVTATSANLSGQPATADPDEVERTLGAAVDLLIDAGPTPGGAPSTVVDVTDERPRLVRAGAISWEEIRRGS